MSRPTSRFEIVLVMIVIGLAFAVSYLWSPTTTEIAGTPAQIASEAAPAQNAIAISHTVFRVVVGFVFFSAIAAFCLFFVFYAYSSKTLPWLARHIPRMQRHATSIAPTTHVRTRPLPLVTLGSKLTTLRVATGTWLAEYRVRQAGRKQARADVQTQTQAIKNSQLLERQMMQASAKQLRQAKLEQRNTLRADTITRRTTAKQEQQATHAAAALERQQQAQLKAATKIAARADTQTRAQEAKAAHDAAQTATRAAMKPEHAVPDLPAISLPSIAAEPVAIPIVFHTEPPVAASNGSAPHRAPALSAATLPVVDLPAVAMQAAAALPVMAVPDSIETGKPVGVEGVSKVADRKQHWIHSLWRIPAAWIGAWGLKRSMAAQQRKQTALEAQEHAAKLKRSTAIARERVRVAQTPVVMASNVPAASTRRANIMPSSGFGVVKLGAQKTLADVTSDLPEDDLRRLLHASDVELPTIETTLVDQNIQSGWSPEDRIAAVAHAIAEQWDALQLESPILGLDTSKGYGRGEVVVTLDTLTSEEQSLIDIPQRMARTKPGWYIRWRGAALVVDVDAKNDAPAAGGPCIVPILDHGRRGQVTHYYPVSSWRHIGIYGADAIGVMHAMLSSIVYTQPPQMFGLVILDNGDAAPFYRGIPHYAPALGDARNCIDTLSRSLRWASIANDVRPLMVVVIDPDETLMTAITGLVRKLRQNPNAPLYLCIVQQQLNRAGREIYAVLPALITYGTAANGNGAWLPGMSDWPKRGVARLVGRGLRIEGRVRKLDEAEVAGLMSAIQGVGVGLPPVLWEAEPDASSVVAAPDIAPLEFEYTDAQAAEKPNNGMPSHQDASDTDILVWWDAGMLLPDMLQSMTGFHRGIQAQAARQRIYSVVVPTLIERFDAQEVVVLFTAQQPLDDGQNERLELLLKAMNRQSYVVNGIIREKTIQRLEAYGNLVPHIAAD